MNIEHLTEEQLRDIISNMVKAGIVEDSVIDEYISGNVSVNLDKATSLLHSVMCFKDHDKECMWYNESCAENKWNKPAHASWLRMTLDIKDEMNIKTDKDLLNNVVGLVDVINKIEESKVNIRLVKLYLINKEDSERWK